MFVVTLSCPEKATASSLEKEGRMQASKTMAGAAACRRLTEPLSQTVEAEVSHGILAVLAELPVEPGSPRPSRHTRGVQRAVVATRMAPAAE